VLLDRLLDSVGLTIEPLAICDLRAGVRMELPPRAEPQMHCILCGHGRLALGNDRAGGEIALADHVVALVPPGIAHGIEPEGGVTRSLTLGRQRSSDHVAALTLGDGASVLLLVSGLIRARAHTAPGLLDGVPRPLGVDLSAVPRAVPLFETLRAEQVGRPLGSRSMTGLLLQQCLVLTLRELSTRADCPLPWVHGIKGGAETAL
jgi:Cupin